MKPLVSMCAVALIVCSPTVAVAQTPAAPVPSDPTVLEDKSQAEIRRIVESREFRRAARSKNVARMNKLLKGTGAVAANPVALFFCLPPETANYRNGQWHCGARKVEPFMYADW